MEIYGFGAHLKHMRSKISLKSTFEWDKDFCELPEKQK